MRYYGFAPEEIVDGASDGMLDLERDPKLAWALRNRALFPIDVNRAPRETLLRVPGWEPGSSSVFCLRGDTSLCGSMMSPASSSR